MKKALLAALTALLLTALTACGGSDEKPEPKLTKAEKKVAANIAKTFGETQTNGQLTKKEADCFATHWVDAAGIDALEKAKLIDKDGSVNSANATFTESLASKFSDAFLGCVDYQKKQAKVMADANTKLDAAKLEECLDENLPSDFIKKYIVASQTQSAKASTLAEQANKKITDCTTEATKSGSTESPSESPSGSSSESPSQ